jgi:acyl carrier protein
MTLPDDEHKMKYLLDFIHEELLYESEDISLTAETELVKEGYLTSLGIIRLLAFLEEHFGITVQASEVQIEDFLTATSIIELIKRKSNLD